jgi:putative DNA primase/helicase
MERAANNPAPLPANVDPETGEILDSTPETPAPKKQSKEPDRPFTPLGFDHGVYYYLASGTQQVTGLTASQHSKANLIQLAPLQYWEREFPAKKGAEWDVAMNTLMRQCEARGVFSPSILRGRGAWYDDGRVMVHLGDQVMVDNDPFKPGRVPSRFVYEARLAMRADVSNPLTAQEAQKYVKLLEMAAWEKPIYATFAAGWCAVAHIGGVLTWRPHIWVVGRRGSGKTHVMSKMIRPVLGDNLLHAQGDTSEAGLRQSLGIDSLPVLFDEAEGPDQRSNERVQNVLSLVRQSSSETGGKILKGTISGRSMEFAIRSCFAFSSINANIMQQSDRSRVTVLELNQEHGKHSFADILKAEADLLSDEYVQRFYARSLAMASTIRHNAEAFAAAAATVLGEQRAGDQIGTLLAGAFSLESDALVTAAEAEAWVAKRDWTEQREEAHSQSDEKMLWKYLLERRVSVNTSRGREDIQVGKLIHYGCGGSSAYSPISVDDAQKVLLTIGMRIGIEQQSVLVSNSHSRIKEMLEGTAWAHNWSRVLKRLPKAEASNSAIYFGFKGSESRAVQVQIDVDMME